jgi:hypothetical protein
MSEFNYTEWMQQNKVGPYEKYSLKEGGPGDEPPTTFPEDDYDDKRDLDEMGNIKDIKIEIPGNSSAFDFGKAAARELIESFGPRDFKVFLQAFTQELSKLTNVQK